MYCDLLPYAQWPLDFQSKKRIVSVETIWGNMVFYEKLYNATTDFDSKSDVWNDRKSLHDRFLIFWWVNFQSPTPKKIMYVRESSRDTTVQLWVVIFMSAYLPDAGFTKFAAGLWTIKDLCKFLVYLLQWTYSLRGYVIYSEALNFIHLQFHEIF